MFPMAALRYRTAVRPLFRDVVAVALVHAVRIIVKLRAPPFPVAHGVRVVTIVITARVVAPRRARPRSIPLLLPELPFPCHGFCRAGARRAGIRFHAALLRGQPTRGRSHRERPRVG